MQRMNKNLLHKTDKFFLDRLADYVEEPGEHVWEAIEKRLSEKETNKPAISGFTVLSVSALILICLSLPFLLIDPASSRHFYSEKKIVDQNTIADNKAYDHTSAEFVAPIKKLNSNTAVASENDQNIPFMNSPVEKKFPISAITPLNSSNDQVVYNTTQLNNFHQMQFLSGDNDSKNNIVADKPASIIIQLPKKHVFSIIPFFSVDHISGRFIEQYEFDNLTINDYSKREKPDLSYTAGVLGSYQLNKKFSLSSGISFSSSMLSITSTAVNALRDAEGKYKFKLATSYGLAEISQSGIQPMAGDSLLVSGATMQFNYISFPVLINYDITGKKLKLAVHGGLALNNVISEKMEVNYNVQNNEEAETINKIEGIRSVFFTLNTGVEARYSLNHKTDISVSPELRYGINAINKGMPIKTYPVNYGLSFNLYLKF